MKTVTINIEPKKGEVIKTTWGLWQDCELPSIAAGTGSYLKWQGTRAIIGEDGRGPEGLPRKFKAALLRPDFDPDTAQHNRRDYAGFDGNQSFKYRGKEAGRISADITLTTDGEYCYFSGGYGDSLSDGLKKFLGEQCRELLVSYARKHEKELHTDAAMRIKAAFRRSIGDINAEIAKLVKHAEAAEELLDAENSKIV